MTSLQNQIGSGCRPWGVPINESRFVGPEYAFRPDIHSDESGTTELLRVCCIGFAPSKFDFGLLAFLDVEIDSDPVADRSLGSTQGLSATEEPSVGAFGVADTKAHLAGTSGSQAL